MYICYYSRLRKSKRGESEYFRMENSVRQGCVMPPRREWRLTNLLYGDNLVLCRKSEEDLKVRVGRFVDVCRRRGLKVNADKSKVVVLDGEEGLECEISYRCCRRKVTSGRKVTGAIRSLVNARGLQLECGS